MYSGIFPVAAYTKRRDSMSEKLVVKYAEAAEMLSTTPQTIKQMVKAGRLKGVRLAGSRHCSGVAVHSIKAVAGAVEPSAASVKALAEGGAK